MPDREMAKEVLNIGLVAEIAGEFHERHLNSWGKVRAIDPEVNIRLVERTVQVIFSAVKKTRNLDDEVLRRYQTNIQILGPMEIESARDEDPLWILGMIYTRFVEGRKEGYGPSFEGREEESQVEHILKEAGSLIENEERRAQVESGRLTEARLGVEKLGREHVAAIEYLTLLGLSSSETDWLSSWKEVLEGDIIEPKIFILLAFRFWSVGKTEFAICVAQEGLKRAEERKADDKASILRFKNSLAYYYAELKRPEDEEKAREFSRDAYEGREDERPIDTRGYVLISYGKNVKEILEGVELCEEARRRGIPFSLYHKHIDRAFEKLKELGATEP